MNKTTILIVEDEAIVAVDLAGMLGRLGYEVKASASCGEEAIRLALEHRPDLLLMDIRLAGAMDGVEAAEVIRRDLDSPVVFLTSYSDQATLERAKKSDPFGYLLKPFEESGLQTQIEMALYKHDTERKLRRLNDELELRVEERTRELRVSEEKLRQINETLEQRVAERTAELLKTNEQLKLFIEHAPAALAMFDSDMRYLSISRRWRSDYGLGERDLIGESHYDVFPEITAEWREAHHRGLAGEVLRAEADRFERADGSVQWLRWEIRPWHDAAGAIGGIVIFTEDNTDIKEAEKALRKSETGFHSLFENMQEGFAFCRMLFDEHGQPLDFVYLDVNKAFGRLTGLEDVTGKKVTEVIPGIKESNPELIERYGRVVISGGTDKFEIEVEPLGIWFSISVYSPEREHFVAVFDNITERKRAEEALRESMRREQERAAELATLLDAVPTPVFIAHDTECLSITGNRAADELLCNPRGAEASLSAPAEVRPRHFRALKDGRELRLDELPAQRAARGTHVEDFEFSIAFDDGTIRHVLGYGTPLMDEEGQPRGAVHVLVDVTERKRAEDELRASKEKFSTMLQAVPIAIALATSPDGVLYNVNPAWLDLTGITRKEDAIGKTSLELGLIADAAQRESILNEFRQNGFVRNFELTFCTRKGVQRTVLINLDRVEIGGCAFILSTMEEITERKRAEEELQRLNENLELRVRERTEKLLATMDSLSAEIAVRQSAEKLLRLSEERYRNVVEDQTELICRFTADGIFTFVNDVYCRVFGKTREELLGNRWQPKAFPDDVPVIEEQLRTMSPSNPVVIIENRVFSGSGEIRWMQFVNRGFFDEEGRIIETQAVGRDITERKLVEEELQAANSTMNRLVRTVAHEFRTPLGLLTGSTDILDRYWDRLTPEKRLEQNEHIRNAARQISSLVNSVTSFQLSGTDRHVKPLQVLDIGGICRSIAAEVETVWGAGHEFIVSIAEDCGSALIDEILFRRILQNLLTNAFRYTPTNGTVSLHALREQSMLLLEITDTGIGIPEEEQALIFDAFYRSRNVEARRGLGLGLSIVREALLQMGGTITVASSKGNGTTMRVAIPFS